MSVRVCHMYVFADIFACICIKTRQKRQKKLPNFCRVLCGNFSFIKLYTVSKKGINSPLFYRLNYARITDPMLYLKSAQVKDFLNILWGLIFCDFCLLIIRANMSMYNFLQKIMKNNTENMGVNNMICIRSHISRFCSDFRHNLGVFCRCYIGCFCMLMYEKIKRHTD